MITELTQDSLLTHFTGVAKGDAEAFRQELRELPPSKLKVACQAVGISVGEDKPKTLAALVKRIVEIKKETSSVAKKKDEKETPASTEVKGAVPEKAKEKKAKEEKPKAAPTVDPALKPITLNVHEEYKKLIPRPSKADYARTKASIKEAFEKGVGLSEKLKVRKSDMTLIDGHTRVQILAELDIPLTEDMIEYVDYGTEEETLWRIVVLNVNRRQLPAIEKIRAVQKYLPKLKEKLKEKRAEARQAKKEGKTPGFLSTTKPPADYKSPQAKSAAKKAEKAHTQTREAVAEASGTSTRQVRVVNWLDKWAKAFTDEKTKEGYALDAIYKRAQEAYHWLKNNKPEIIAEIADGKRELMDAFEEFAPAFPPKERKVGPVEKAIVDVKDMVIAVLTKKYGGDPTPDEFEADIIARLDTMIEKFTKKNV